MHLARPIRREDDERRLARAHGAELGDRDLKFREQFEQISFELLVGAIDLVDEEHGRTRSRRVDRLQQRPLDQKRFAVQLATGARAVDRAGGLEDAQLEELPRVVPLVHGVRDVETLIALESDEIGTERRGNGAGERGLADAGFALEEQRTPETESQEQRDREPSIGDVMLCGERPLEIRD